MMVVGRMRVNGMVVMMVVMMSSSCSLLRRTGIRREAERMERCLGLRDLFFRHAMVMMVVARGSCQHQRGRTKRQLDYLLVCVGMMVMMMRWLVCCFGPLAASLASRWGVPTIHAITVLAIVFSQSASCFSTICVFVDIHLPGWTAA